MAGPLHDRCQAPIDEGRVHPQLNLQFVGLIDSVGIGLLIGLSTHCKANRGSFKLTNASSQVKTIPQSQQLGDFLHA